MTDRHAGYLITLEQDIRDDEAQPILIALRQIRGVLSVEPVVSDIELHIAEERAELKVRTQVIKALYLHSALDDSH